MGNFRGFLKRGYVPLYNCLKKGDLGSRGGKIYIFNLGKKNPFGGWKKKNFKNGGLKKPKRGGVGNRVWIFFGSKRGLLGENPQRGFPPYLPIRWGNPE